MKNVERYESLFRQATPVFLLGLLLVVLLEPWLPYGDWLRATFGEQIVLRAVVFFLLCYVILLWGESLRLHGLLTGLLEAFKSFAQERASEQGSSEGAGRSARSPKGAQNPKARLEAARLLIAAMRSDDAAIRETSRHNLARLVGKDLGQDPDAWQRWLDAQG